MTIGADTSQLDKAIEASEDAVKNLSKTGKTAVGALDKITGGLATRFLEARAGINSLIKGMNLTKVAIAATGIGALVIAFGALMTYFTKTKRGAEILQRATASLGAVMGVLTDAVSSFGEWIYKAFTEPKKTITELGSTIKSYILDNFNQMIESLGLLGSAIKKVFSGDFAGAAEDAKNGIKGVADAGLSLNPLTAVAYNYAKGIGQIASDANAAAEAAYRLAEAEQALADSRRATQVETAKQRAEIKRLNLIAEDTTKSIGERIQAAERAGEIERELFERRRAEAEEALRIRREQNALSESTAEDLQAEADLETEVYNLQAESLELQTTLQNKLNTLRQEAAQQWHDENVTQMEAIQSRAAGEIELEQTKQGLILEGLRTIEVAEIDAATKRRRRIRDEIGLYADLAHERLAQTVQFTQDILSITDSLNTLFAKDEEKRAKKSFQIQKAAGISAATIATANAVADALAKDATFPGSRFLAAAAAGAAGAAQIATIARQQFQSAVSGIEEPTAPNLTQPSLAVAGVPSFQLPTQDAFRSYVLASDVNTAQQASQKVKDQALLLG